MKRLMTMIGVMATAFSLLADADSKYGNLDSLQCKKTVKGDTVVVEFRCGYVFGWNSDQCIGSMKIFTSRPAKARKRGRKTWEEKVYKMSMTARKSGKKDKEVVEGEFVIKDRVITWTWTYTNEDKDHDLRRRDISLKPSFELVDISKEEDD